MPNLICYDISQNSLRTQIARKIIDAGLDRVNKSVYLGTISDRSLTALEKDLATKVQSKGTAQDSLIILTVSVQQIHTMRVYGTNGLDKDEITGDKDTLIL